MSFRREALRTAPSTSPRSRAWQTTPPRQPVVAMTPSLVALEQLPVEAGLVEVPLEEGGRRQLDQVLVARGGLGQQGEVVVELLAPLALAAPVVDPAPAHGALEAALAGHVGLDAEHGRDPGLAGGPVEVEDAVHVAVVGDADGGLAVGHGRGHDLVDPGGPVEHRELGVDVEMGEALPHQATPLRITLWNNWGNKLQPCNLALVATACEVSSFGGGRRRVVRHPSAGVRAGPCPSSGPTAGAGNGDFPAGRVVCDPVVYHPGAHRASKHRTAATLGSLGRDRDARG